jgi:hypothetical protein
MPSEQYSSFMIRFDEQRYTPAVIIPPKGDVNRVVEKFGLRTPRHVLFLSGGAGLMSVDDMHKTYGLFNDCIAPFAERHDMVVIDGGTDSGVMKMLGEIREANGYHFPLVGIAPRLKVSYPSFENAEAEAALQRGHSHFILIESNDWGEESQTIVDLTRAIAGGERQMMGLLVNGGQIAEQDIYLATSDPKGKQRKIPILVLEGSGRKADEVSMAYKSGFTSSKLIRAIIKGGDIRIVHLGDGVEAMQKKLADHFGV